MISLTCVIILCILIYILYNQGSNNIEEFNNQKNKKKSQQLWKNRDLFKQGSTYSNAKNHIEWIDPVIYDDVNKESTKNNLTEAFLINMVY